MIYTLHLTKVDASIIISALLVTKKGMGTANLALKKKEG